MRSLTGPQSHMRHSLPTIQFKTKIGGFGLQNGCSTSFLSFWTQRIRFRCHRPPESIVQWTVYLLGPQKLQPYFPPLEPLQSAELRAVLFRALNELKKDGVFGKDIFIRKSMLDDCKGTKFEDMLATLSTSVLQKVLADDETDESVARKLILDTPDSHIYYKSMLPLTVGYRAALTGQLRERKELKFRYCRFGRLLDMKKDELAQRTQNFSETAHLWKEKTIPRRTVDKLKKHVEVNWYGDKAWVDILTKSDRYPMTNSLIERPFEQVWPHVTNDTVHKIRPDHRESLLENLEKRVAAQNERLDMWKKIQESLVTETDAEGLEEAITQEQTEPPLLTIQSRKSEAPGRDLEESDHVDRFHSGRGHSRTCSLRATEVSSVASDQRLPSVRFFKERSSPSKPPNKLANSQAFHMRTHSSSKMNTPSSSADDSLSFIRPEITNDCSTDVDEDMDLVSSLQKMSVSENAHGEREIASSETHKAFLPALDQISTHATDEDGSNISAELPRSPQKLSLVERTRMSLATMSPLKSNHPAIQAPSASTLPTNGAAEDDTQYFDPPALDLHRSETLLDRTRQSMSLMSARPQGRHVSQRPRSSIVYPTNQLDSPRKITYSYEEDNTSILEEILPDLDVDYETVFKSRPKIALSPRLKPVTYEVPNIEEALDEGASIEDFS